MWDTMWKFQDFSATQILREINFGYLKPQRTAILTIPAAVNFEFLGILAFSTVKFPKSQNSKLPKLVKWQLLTYWNQPRLISRKIRGAGKLLNLSTVPKVMSTTVLVQKAFPKVYSVIQTIYELPKPNAFSTITHHMHYK